MIWEYVISKEVRKVSNKKGCPLTPFLYHLYYHSANMIVSH